jgi:transcriptional regulator with XRE-family HTH domain
MAAKGKREFADLLRHYRLAKNLSFGALARRAGLYSKISPSHIVRLEKGDRKTPSREKAIALAKGLELSAKEADAFLESAGHHPVSENSDSIPALKNPAVVAVLKLLKDETISSRKKLGAQENIVSYVTWLHAELASRGKPNPPRSATG